MSKSRLKLGKLIPLERKRGFWWDKAWGYYIDGIHMGTIYKQLYPSHPEPMLVYKYLLQVKVLPIYWAEVPANQKKVGIISNHYKNKTEARKAMKKALIKQIRYLNKISCQP